MAKTPKIKKQEVSIHSRAARRASSPTPKTAGLASVETEYKPWLHSAHDAGIRKKKVNKQLTRQQKLRQQRGMEKADMNGDKLEKKVANSKGRGRKIQARRVDWDELNSKSAIAVPEENAVKSTTHHQQPELDDAMSGTASSTLEEQPSLVLNEGTKIRAIKDVHGLATDADRQQRSVAAASLEEVDEVT